VKDIDRRRFSQEHPALGKTVRPELADFVAKVGLGIDRLLRVIDDEAVAAKTC
jgi:hypothetical protein